MIKTETVTINGRQFIHTWSDDGMKIVRDGIEYDDAFDPADIGRAYEETADFIEDIADEVKQMQTKYAELKEKYDYAEVKAELLDRIKARIIELRDSAKLQTTKAIYNAILELFDE